MKHERNLGCGKKRINAADLWIEEKVLLQVQEA